MTIGIIFWHVSPNYLMSNKPRIVIADDDYSDRYLIRTAFEEVGIDVDIAEYEDGAELIAFLNDGCQANPPCFILLDLNMPKKTGMDVLEYLKENPVCGAPVIVLSTSANQSDIDRSKQLGATDYIIKPVDYDGYLAIVKSLNKYFPTC
jgi:CheY-like chemotaxis protein